MRGNRILIFIRFVFYDAIHFGKFNANMQILHFYSMALSFPVCCLPAL